MSEDLKERLQALVADGLTFGTTVEVFAERQADTGGLDAEELKLDYVALAKQEWEREGEIEINDNAIVSKGSDRGAYVMAWVWVYDPETDQEETPTGDDARRQPIS